MNSNIFFLRNKPQHSQLKIIPSKNYLRVERQQENNLQALQFSPDYQQAPHSFLLDINTTRYNSKGTCPTLFPGQDLLTLEKDHLKAIYVQVNSSSSHGRPY